MKTKVDPKELMLHCMEVNCNYMRLPAGLVNGYDHLVSLYQRIASQLRECAQAWLEDKPCPPHEPAAEAFIWAVVAWADAFGLSMGVDPVEWGRKFVKPHYDFANYLRPGERPEGIEPHAALPAETIMELDVRWMKLVVKLTARWGLFQHMKDMPALREAERLERELRNDHSQVRDAYLRSDLKFFDALFEPFPFKYQTRHQIKDWLAMAAPDSKEGEPMMRNVSCKVCGGRWAARRGTIIEFYQDHARRHDLLEPHRFEGESEEDYLDRFVSWRDQYFEDSLKREEMSDGEGAA